jgi:outer membrane protein
MRNTVMVVLIAGFLLAGPAWAAPEAPAAEAALPAAPAAPTAPAVPGQKAGADLEAARRGALARSSALKKAGVDVTTALLDEKGEGYAFYPSIAAKAGLSLSLASPVSASVSAGLDLGEKLYDGGRSRIQAAIDRLATAGARTQARSAALAAVQAAEQAYWAVLEADASIGAAMSDLEASRTAQGLAEAKFAAGTIIGAELLKAKADLASKEVALAQARSARMAASARLASLTGLDAGASLEDADFSALEGLMERIAKLDEAGIAALVARVLDSAALHNPDLEAARLLARKAGLAVDLARTASLPSLGASLGSQLTLRSGSGTPLGYTGSLSLSASLPLDLWNGKLSVDKALAQAEAPALDLEEETRSLELSVRTSIYSWIVAAQTALASALSYDYAQANYANSLELYRHSAASLTELSAATLLASTSRQQLYKSRYAFLSSQAGLKALAGLEEDALLLALLP